MSSLICLVLPSVAAFLAAQVPGGLALSPGETLEGLADVRVGLEGLYGLLGGSLGGLVERDGSKGWIGRTC